MAESKIKFDHPQVPGEQFETLHSLSKWKRYILTEHKFEPYSGIYAEGHYIRANDEIDDIHSLYVLQYDWEQTIKKEDRSIAFLKTVVEKIYSGLREIEDTVVA